MEAVKRWNGKKKRKRNEGLEKREKTEVCEMGECYVRCSEK